MIVFSGLYKKEEGSNIMPELTSGIAQEIHALYQLGLDITGAFKKGYNNEHCKIVWNEIRSLESQAIVAVSKPVEEQPANQATLEAQLSSEILNINTVVTDIVAYNPNYNADRTFDQFKAVYVVSE